MNYSNSEQVLENKRLIADLAKKQKKRQTEVEIYNQCKKKYEQTKVHLAELEVKKKKLEDEISHLQQKQSDRERFLTETYQHHQKN
jgi:predicted nuclease with TOPRIM domain